MDQPVHSILYRAIPILYCLLDYQFCTTWGDCRLRYLIHRSLSGKYRKFKRKSKYHPNHYGYFLFHFHIRNGHDSSRLFIRYGFHSRIAVTTWLPAWKMYCMLFDFSIFCTAWFLIFTSMYHWNMEKKTHTK